MELDIDLSGFEGYILAEHVELYCDDLKAVNDKDLSRVLPVNSEVTGASSVTLKKHSWNMLRFKKA